MRKLTNKTATNKLYAVLSICAGILSVSIDGNGIGLIFGCVMGIPLFLAKKNVII